MLPYSLSFSVHKNDSEQKIVLVLRRYCNIAAKMYIAFSKKIIFVELNMFSYTHVSTSSVPIFNKIYSY